MNQRRIRILIYEGTPEWIQKTTRMDAVKGSRIFANCGCIKEAVVGDFLESIYPVNEGVCNAGHCRDLKSQLCDKSIRLLDMGKSIIQWLWRR